MKMDIVAGSKDNEWFTPPYAVDPILRYIPKYSLVWCPFDTEDSWYVKKLHEHDCEVIATHIQNGWDFFDMNTPECDIILSNPPYSCRTEVLQKLFEIDKPFGMLLGVVGLFESQKRFEMFRDNEFEIMYFNRRVSFFKDYSEQKPSVHPPFSTVYVCHKLLPQPIVFEEIVRNF